MYMLMGGMIVGTLLTAGGYESFAAGSPAKIATHKVAIGANTPDPTVHGYTLGQLRTAYNVTPLYALGYDGQGQTVAIVAPNFNGAAVRRNLAQFTAFYHLPKADVKFVHVAGQVPVVAGFDIEATLDASYVHGFAPDAKIVFVEDNYRLGAFQYILQHHVSAIVSYSENWPEAIWNPKAIRVYNDVLQQLAHRDTTILKGVGDWGASDESGSTARYSNLPFKDNVNFPASSPWVTALGGTQLTLRQNGTYLSERAWSLSGGGYSRIFKRPVWQVNPGIKPSEAI